jgi:BirA family biotin operon repressor/biotin-[acetyl-CoA-carboxylase] ligase
MKQVVLQLLIENKGNYVSGEAISNTLSVSRTAVWKHINTLKTEGYNIISSSGKGYCLLERPDLLSFTEIKIGLKTKKIGQNILCFAKIDSTNEAAKRVAITGAPEGTVVVADQQEHGKGRLDRHWVSSPAVGLWFSIILRPDLQPAQAVQSTFVSAIAVCKVLRKATGLPFSIKWPNDILVQNRKVCGILTELSAELERINYIVVGIGLNVNQQKEDFPLEIREKATSLLLASGRSFNRAELLRNILLEYEEQYQSYLHKGFGWVLQIWRELNSTLGKEVLVNTREGSFTGVAEDINEDGCLVVKKHSGAREVLIAGDVSLRDANDEYW